MSAAQRKHCESSEDGEIRSCFCFHGCSVGYVGYCNHVQNAFIGHQLYLHSQQTPGPTCVSVHRLIPPPLSRMSVPPFVPPLPPGLRVQSDSEYRPSPPHLEEPLLAPRPHKVTPDLPAEVGPITNRCSIYS